jgi:hypothetical protein
LIWPEETLVVTVHPKAVELWRVQAAPRTPASSETAAPPTSNTTPAPPEKELAQRLGTVLAENIPAHLPALLRTACERGPACSPAILFVANDATFFLVRSTLRALTAVSLAERHPVVQLRQAAPDPVGTPPRVRVRPGAVSGRLPAEVIQRIMRGNFDDLRRCYEAGLARDPALTGKVVLRIIIGRDGDVPHAGATEATIMPDTSVTECVVKHLRTMRFPKPEGGVVTVVYPIVFAPKE